jgi:hypothetical protein
MSHIIYEDWYDLNSETNEILKLKMLKENGFKECNMCKKYMDYILFLENSIQQLKNIQIIVYKNEQVNRKTIL